MGWLQRVRGWSARDKEQADAPQAMAALGTDWLALPAHQGAALPERCLMLYVDPAGHVRQAREGKVAARSGESAWCVHVGPYRCAFPPFAAAPELGLRLDYCIDAGADLARFGLLLASESVGPLAAGAFTQAVQDAVQSALQQGALELPPCVSAAEWQSFRAGLDELMFTRFGVTVEDCVPHDLHPAVDFAAQLRQAAASVAEPCIVMPDAATAPALPDYAPDHASPADDARALRRLFLELPALAAALRALPLAEGQFAQRQDALRRLALAALEASTMPALGLAAPGVALAQDTIARRIAQALAAQAALEQGWAVLAQWRAASAPAPLDELERILSNLAVALAARRSHSGEEGA